MSEPTIHIHEDDYGMRSLHPMTAWEQVADDLREAAAAAEANRAPDGIGWTDLHVIRPPDEEYETLLLAPLAEDLAAVSPRIRKFAATSMAGFGGHDPWGAYQDDAWCFGFNGSCFLKLEPSGDRVRRIWFDVHGDMARLDAMRRMMEIIDRAEASFVVDYWMSCAGPVADSAFMERYFKALSG